MPAPMQNDVKMESAEDRANGVKYYIEVANMPTTNDALNYRGQKNMDRCSVQGCQRRRRGVSALEMAQNSERLVWTADEVDASCIR